MEGILNKDIRLAGIEEKDNLIVIKDQDGTKYSFFKTKRDGGQTQAHSQFQFGNHNGPFRSGDIARVGFKEDIKQNSYGKSVTYRNIISILSSNAPIQNSAPPTTTPSQRVASQAPQDYSEDTKWERIGKLKALHNLAGRRLSSGATIDQVMTEVPQYMAVALEIERVIDGTSGNSTPAASTEIEETINVDDIPF